MSTVSPAPNASPGALISPMAAVTSPVAASAPGIDGESLARPSNPPLGAPQGREWKTFKALRHRNFQLFVGGQLVSLAGTWMQVIAQGWLVYELTKSEMMLGVVGFASAIPAFLISPWAGVVIDRVPKRRLLIATQTASMILAFVMSALVFTGIVQVWMVVVVAVLLGAVNAFDGPGRQSFVVEMVGRDDLPNAIALNSMTFNAARVIGPAFGGLLLASVGAAWCFFLNGLSFIAVIVSLFMMRIVHQVVLHENKSPWEQMKGGFAYTARQPDLRAFILLALFFSSFGIAFMTVMPAYVDRVLHVGAAAYGLLTSALGAGAVTGALLLATYGDRGKRGMWLFVSGMIYPVLLTIFAFTQSLPVALGLAYFLGLGFMFQFALFNTLIQTRVHDSMRGRVMSIYTLTFMGFAPFGNLAISALAEVIGLSAAITLSAAIWLTAAAAIYRWTPELKRLP